MLLKFRAKSFLEHLGDAIMSLALIGFFMHLWHPVHNRQSMNFNSNIANIPNLDFRSIIFLLILSTAGKY